MPYVGTGPLTDWESPDSFDSAAEQLAKAGSAVGDILERQHEAWAKVGDVYEGEAEPILLAAWDGPMEHGDKIAVGTARADEVLTAFSRRLSHLLMKRQDFEDERGYFNANYGGMAEEDLPLTAKYTYDLLLPMPEVLQQTYQDLVDACVRGLDAIRESTVDTSARQEARGTDWGEILRGIPEGIRDGVPGLFEHGGPSPWPDRRFRR